MSLYSVIFNSFRLTFWSSVGMKKKLELFLFFGINNAISFKNKVRSNVVPRITSTTDLLTSPQPQVMLNIAFSRTGLNALGQATSFQEPAFDGGMFTDVGDLGVANVATNWISAFQGTNIHGVFLIASVSISPEVKASNQTHIPRIPKPTSTLKRRSL